MFSVPLFGGLPVAHARRVLTVVIAAAIAIGPVGSAMAVARDLHTSPAQSIHAQPHAGHHKRAATATAMPQTQEADQHCDRTNLGDCCCGDHKANCAETCLHKCFGQLSLIPSSRFVAAYVLDQFDMRAVERPPDWVHDLQTPPPRT